MSGRAEKRLATLLNSCNAENILVAARSDIMALIEDHFLSDQVEEDWPESDSEDEMDLRMHKTCVTSKMKKKMMLLKKLWFTSKVQRDITALKLSAMVLQWNPPLSVPKRFGFPQQSMKHHHAGGPQHTVHCLGKFQLLFDLEQQFWRHGEFPDNFSSFNLLNSLNSGL